MTSLLKCICGPRLFRIHRYESRKNENYAANSIENFSDSVIRWIRFFKAFCQWTSPALLMYMYRRDYFTIDGAIWLTEFVGILVVAYGAAVCLRGLGRYANADYCTFLKVLETAKTNKTPENLRRLKGFDSEMFAWPIDFSWKEVSESKEKRKKIPEDIPNNPKRSRGFAEKVKGLPCDVLSYIAIHTFGRRMIYPGATCIQVLMAPMLNQGRNKQIEELGGLRAKLEAEDGNGIDTMFIDRRNNTTCSNGNTLVVCCEGNAGFYEIGCTTTPTEAGYSVLGWNHPGFSGSSGIPWPSSEQKAIDVVMQYAIQRLGFHIEDIVLFSWSIGGYASTWSAMTYPDIRHIVLDATFDDILPLAVNRMPQSFRSLVVRTIRRYMNLNNAEQLCKYPGPVLLIRRTNDEMITTSPEPGVLSTNRGNDLLIQLLQQRYPKLLAGEDVISVLRTWLAADKAEQIVMWSEKGVEEDICISLLRSYALENSVSYPMLLGTDMDETTKVQLTLFLASKYMIDFDSSHSTPLPANMFREPWTIPLEFSEDKGNPQ